MVIPITESGDAVQFAVRVVPRAGRSGVAGIREGALVVRLAAPPVEGAANEALVAYLAELMGRPRRDVAILSGQKSRTKRVQISGVTARELDGKLSGILPP
ncbi:MAG TPA: DUF167 domain-containing protein [Vicinamibacterales bacterium]|nr:DUF167 domain-containing protein [Vicinamibacterales bacterium]